jgi:hypothetical protein
MIAIEMARWGGSAMSEVDRVGQRLKSKIGDNERGVWNGSARRSASRRWATMRPQKIILSSAASHYLRAATYYFVGERFVKPGAKKTELYQKLSALFPARDQGALSEHRAR